MPGRAVKRPDAGTLIITTIVAAILILAFGPLLLGW
jgi:hypothetical protein